MKEKPILFSGTMVRAILEGRKSQTRRVLAEQPNAHTAEMRPFDFAEKFPAATAAERKRFTGACFESRGPIDLAKPDKHCGYSWHHCPYGGPGDRLWVKETWQTVEPFGIAYNLVHPGKGMKVLYRATDDDGLSEQGFPWRPSIFMPRWASRITLEITRVRAERLQHISEGDAWAEGVQGMGVTRYSSEARDLFRELWEHINGPKSWDANPWVWVVEFRRVKNRGITSAFADSAEISG